MKTGPHSFLDATGVEWHITGYSKSCGEMYADCRSADGKALTVRPVAYLGPAGLSVPEGSVKPVRKRKLTAKDKREAEETATRLLAVDAARAAHAEGCECGNCSHVHYGCLICGSKEDGCTPTQCETDMPPEQIPDGPGDHDARAGLTGRAYAVHCKREPYDVLIDRTTPWGNPYSHKEGTTAQHIVATREEAVEHYREWIKARLRAQEPGLLEALAGLHGKRLGCWCAPDACHGDVLADAAEWAVGVLAAASG